MTADMKMVFMGTPEFAAESLRALREADMTPSAVVTQPDRPQGRGNLMIPSPVKKLALEYGIPVYQPQRVEAIADKFKELAPDFFIVVAYGQLLPRHILNIPVKCCINVHASLLPAYRGASPINWAIINGDTETGVTTMVLDEGMDTGDILLVEKVAIASDDTASALHDRLAVTGARLLTETLRRFDEIKPQKQDERFATYAPKLTRNSGCIDWSRPAVEIRNIVRGCDPWPSAFTFLKGNMIKIWSVEVRAGSGTLDSAPGTVLSVSDTGIEVASGIGIVFIKEIQREGKKRQTVETFLRGYPISEGERFEAR